MQQQQQQELQQQQQRHVNKEWWLVALIALLAAPRKHQFHSLFLRRIKEPTGGRMQYKCSSLNPRNIHYTTNNGVQFQEERIFHNNSIFRRMPLTPPSVRFFYVNQRQRGAGAALAIYYVCVGEESINLIAVEIHLNNCFHRTDTGVCLSYPMDDVRLKYSDQ